eukprot:7672858-Ditylum_brightwellii.AAC.1
MTEDVRGAMKLDQENGNSLWLDAQKKESRTLRNMDTFELMPKNFDVTGYQYISLINAWDVKFDGRRRVCLVANEKVTIRPPERDVCSGVIKTESVHTAMFLAMLNGMKLLVADMSSAYIMAETKEIMYTRLGPEFGNWAGKLAIIRKGLYGVIGSCAQFHCQLCAEVEKKGFKSSKANPDLWTRDTCDHCKYVAKFIHDILVMPKDPKVILDLI